VNPTTHQETLGSNAGGFFIFLFDRPQIADFSRPQTPGDYTRGADRGRFARPPAANSSIRIV